MKLNIRRINAFSQALLETRNLNTSLWDLSVLYGAIRASSSLIEFLSFSFSRNDKEKKVFLSENKSGRENN